MSAEEHYYKVHYVLKDNFFSRKVIITDVAELQKQVLSIDTLKSKYAHLNVVQQYRLEYNFAKKIKSISNKNAKVADNGKSFVLDFLISDCLQNPESTSLEVELE